MQLVPGFALNEEARRHTYAESGSLSYGLSFRLRLLSTPPRSDAVSFSYIVVTSYGMDFHLADKAPSRTHSFQRTLESSSFTRPSSNQLFIQVIPLRIFLLDQF